MVWNRRKLNTCLSSSISSSVIRFFNFWLLLLHDKDISEITKLSTLLKIFRVLEISAVILFILDNLVQILTFSGWMGESVVVQSTTKASGMDRLFTCCSSDDLEFAWVVFLVRFLYLHLQFSEYFEYWRVCVIVGWISISHFVRCSISKSTPCVKLPILGKHFFSPLWSWCWHSFRWFVIAAVFSPFPPRLTIIWQPQINHLRFIGKRLFSLIT